MGVFFLFLVLIWCDPHPIGLYCALIQKAEQFHNSPLTLIHFSPFLFSLYCCEGIRWCQNSSGWRHHQSQVQFIWLSHLEETHNILTMEVEERFRDGERKLLQGCDLSTTNRQWFIYPDAPFQSDLRRLRCCEMLSMVHCFIPVTTSNYYIFMTRSLNVNEFCQ